MYLPIWLVPEFLSSIIHLKCVLNVVLVPWSRLVWRVQLTLGFTHSRVPVWYVLSFWAVSLLAFNWFVARDYKGDRDRGHPPYTPYSTGNSSRVIFRIGIELPRARRGRFVEVSHDQTLCKTCRARGNESVKRSRAFLNIEAKWVGAHLGKWNRWTLWQPVKSV